MRKKQKQRYTKDNEMELVDIFYIPSTIAKQFSLLRDHCAAEVIQVLHQAYPRVEKATLDTDVGEVIVAYNETGEIQKIVELSPVSISKLEKEISADRLEKFLFSNESVHG